MAGIEHERRTNAFISQNRAPSNEETFLFELMDFTHLIGPNVWNTADEMWNDYRLETPSGIGFVILARKVSSGTHQGAWEIHSWYTYNV